MSTALGFRPPVVTILGHVDHGKTSLLDRIRHANVAAGEVGGITQAIGAYQIEHQGRKITFIDTPGHAAFSAMRRRGGQAADIAILLVAADDSVMPQTRESIEHIRSANIPFVVAVNKSDLPGTSLDKVKTDLANEGVYVEGYGGNVPIVPISAKVGTGIEELLEIILLLADIQELKDTSSVKPGSVLVIESSLHPQKGPLATLLVKQGTFKINSPLYLGKEVIGKIRSMIDPNGNKITEAIPSTPFQVIGLSVVPMVGDILYSEIAEESAAKLKVGNATIDQEKPNIILKADVQGSLEAIEAAIQDKVNIISSSVGSVTDTDISNAVASGSEIIGFNSKLISSVSKLAEVEKVKFTNFKIIYQLFDYLDEIKNRRTEDRAPKEIINGEAKVLKVFTFGKTVIYGCICLSGKMLKNTKFRDSIISSLKIGKEDVEEVKKDQEFGLVLNPNIELKSGDIIQSIS